MASPGRPKGTRVTLCSCGRRVAGELGKRVPCPDCGKRVTIKAAQAKKRTRVFIAAKKKR